MADHNVEMPLTVCSGSGEASLKRHKSIWEKEMGLDPDADLSPMFSSH